MNKIPYFDNKSKTEKDDVIEPYRADTPAGRENIWQLNKQYRNQAKAERDKDTDGNEPHQKEETKHVRQRIIIIRGISGSGKTTLAKEIAEDSGAIVLENDHWFERPWGYEFDSKQLRKAYSWCKLQAEKYIRGGRTVVVSNTFCRIQEFEDYLALADKYYVVPRVITLKSQYGNIHNVPEIALERQRSNWEDFEGEEIRITDNLQDRT